MDASWAGRYFTFSLTARQEQQGCGARVPAQKEKEIEKGRQRPREGAPRARKQVKMMPRRFSNFESERGNGGFLYHGVYLADMNAKRFARCNGVTE